LSSVVALAEQAKRDMKAKVFLSMSFGAPRAELVDGAVEQVDTIENVTILVDYLPGKADGKSILSVELMWRPRFRIGA